MDNLLRLFGSKEAGGLDLLRQDSVPEAVKKALILESQDDELVLRLLESNENGGCDLLQGDLPTQVKDSLADLLTVTGGGECLFRKDGEFDGIRRRLEDVRYDPDMADQCASQFRLYVEQMATNHQRAIDEAAETDALDEDSRNCDPNDDVW